MGWKYILLKYNFNMKKNKKIGHCTYNNSLKDAFTLFIVFLAIMSIYFFFTGRQYIVSYIFYFVALFYLSGFPLSYILHRKKDKFRCMNCGECCKLKFKLKKSDIIRFEKGKVNWKEFVDENWNVKRINGYCSFLIHKNGKKLCSVYKYRPYTCRGWPFFSSSFSISWPWFFSCPPLRKLIKE